MSPQVGFRGAHTLNTLGKTERGRKNGVSRLSGVKHALVLDAAQPEGVPVVSQVASREDGHDPGDVLGRFEVHAGHLADGARAQHGGQVELVREGGNVVDEPSFPGGLFKRRQVNFGSAYRVQLVLVVWYL